MDVEDEVAVSEQNEFIEAYNAVAIENEEVTNFKESVKKAVLEIACKLNAIMILPRELVYNIFKNFEKLLKTHIIDGMS